MDSQDLDPASQPQADMPSEKPADIMGSTAFKLGRLTEQAHARHRWQIAAFALFAILVVSLILNLALGVLLLADRQLITHLRDENRTLQNALLEPPPPAESEPNAPDADVSPTLL